MPFKEDMALLLAAARLASHAADLAAPRRMAGIAVAGAVPMLESALASAVSQLTMSFNEFNNFCLAEARDAVHHGTPERPLEGPPAETALVTIDWHGGGHFLLCLAAPPEAALAFCRTFAARRAEFARVHRWPERSVLGISAGEILWTHGGPDGQRALRPFGEPLARARRLAAHGEALAAAEPGLADVLVCGPELEDLIAAALEDEGGEGSRERARITCASA